MKRSIKLIHFLSDLPRKKRKNKLGILGIKETTSIQIFTYIRIKRVYHNFMPTN